MRMALRNIRRMLIHRSRPCLFSNQREENEKFITLTSSRTELSVLAIFHTCDADRRLSIAQNVSVLHSVALSAPFVCWRTGNFHARITETVTDLIRVMSFWLTGRLVKCTWGENWLHLQSISLWCLVGEMWGTTLFESLWETHYL